MKTLLLLRHAKSSWDAPDQPDHDRPLNDRGKRDAPRVGQLLNETRLRPALVLSSTAKRARKTAAKVLEAGGYALEVQLRRELYLADVGTWVRVLQALPDEANCVLAVGHNPGIEDLVQVLCGGRQTMPTAALAHVELPVDSWSQLTTSTPCELRMLWTP
jgi:phosphohistidine phosphatase